jgi:hypothetical protein
MNVEYLNEKLLLMMVSGLCAYRVGLLAGRSIREGRLIINEAQSIDLQGPVVPGGQSAQLSPVYFQL